MMSPASVVSFAGIVLAFGFSPAYGTDSPPGALSQEAARAAAVERRALARPSSLEQRQAAAPTTGPASVRAYAGSLGVSMPADPEALATFFIAPQPPPTRTPKLRPGGILSDSTLEFRRTHDWKSVLASEAATTVSGAVHPLRRELENAIIKSSVSETRYDRPRTERILLHQGRLDNIIADKLASLVLQADNARQAENAERAKQGLAPLPEKVITLFPSQPPMQTIPRPDTEGMRLFLASHSMHLVQMAATSEDDLVWFYTSIGMDPDSVERLLDLNAKWSETFEAVKRGDTTASQEALWLAAEQRAIVGPERGRLIKDLYSNAITKGIFEACGPAEFDAVLAPAFRAAGAANETVDKLREINRKLLETQSAPEITLRLFVERNRLFLEQQKLTTAEQKLKAMLWLRDNGATVVR